MEGSKYFQTAVLYGLIAKSVSVNEHLEQISLYIRHSKKTPKHTHTHTHTHSHRPANRPFSYSAEISSDKCVQASIYETKYNVIKVYTGLSLLISDHASSVTF